MERPDRSRDNKEVERENEVEQRPGSSLDVMQSNETTAADELSQPPADQTITNFKIEITGGASPSEFTPTATNIAIDHVGAGLTGEPVPAEHLLPIEDLDFTVANARSDAQEVIVMDQDGGTEPASTTGESAIDTPSTNLVLGEDEFVQDQLHAVSENDDVLSNLADDDDDPFDGL
jgi:hypothetical protein